MLTTCISVGPSTVPKGATLTGGASSWCYSPSRDLDHEYDGIEPGPGLTGGRERLDLCRGKPCLYDTKPGAELVIKSPRRFPREGVPG